MLRLRGQELAKSGYREVFMKHRSRINREYQPNMPLKQPTWEQYIEQKISPPVEQGSRKIPLEQPTWDYQPNISVTMQQGKEKAITYEGLSLDLEPKGSSLF